MKIATHNDWPDLKPMSQEPVIVELDEHFDDRQMNRLRQGFVPVAPAQKWFLYFEDDTLHCHRSWTGCKMFEVVFEPEAAGAVARTARVNLDPGFYSGTFEQARKTLFELLRHHAGDGEEAQKPGNAE